MKIRKFTISEPCDKELDYEIFFIVDDDNYADVYCSTEYSADKQYVIGMYMDDWMDWADAETEEEFYQHLPVYIADYMSVEGYFLDILEHESAIEGHNEVKASRMMDVQFLENVFTGLCKFRRWSQDDDSPEMMAFKHFVDVMIEHEL